MHWAIARLETAGARVSVRQIHRLTGGSFRDVSRLLRALRPLRPTATVQSVELAIAEQTRMIGIYRAMVRTTDARWASQCAALLRQSETRVARLQEELQSRAPHSGKKAKNPL